MIAIYKRELKSFFHTFVGWLFLAVTLFLMGIYFTVYNMLAGYPTISYVLQSIVFLYIITIPILTMRVLSEDRKNKTDQMILTAPVSVGRIVLGKYLAFVTILAIPTVIIGLAPLALMQAGEFQIGISYASLLGFFLYGCLALAIGLFLSSLTESVVIAAVLTLGVLFLGYIMSGICSILSSSGTTLFSEVLSKILKCFDMVSRFDMLCSGYLQLEAVAYFITLTIFVLFCTTQSIQKRRYSVSGKGIRLGAYSTLTIVVMAALVVGINLLLNYVPDQYVSFDVTANKIYTLTDDTKEMVSGLNDDVTIYVLVEEASKDEDLDKTLTQLKGLSDHIKVEYISPVANPKFYYNYTTDEPTDNSLIVVGPNNSTVVDYNDIYEWEFNYSSYSYEVTGYDGEGQLASAITYVTTEDIPKFYLTMGHGELEFEDTFLSALTKENATYEDLTLYTVDEIPEDAQGIIINAPTSDFSEDDADKVIAFLENGGNALLIPTFTDEDMTQFERILAYYGVSLVDGIIVEGDREYYYQSPYYLFPEIAYDEVTQRVTDGAIFAPLSRGLTYDDDTDGVYYTPLLTTSDSSFSKTDVTSAEDYNKSENDIDGPFTIALKAEKTTDSDQTSDVFIVANESMFTSLADNMVPGYNMKLFSSMISSLAEHENSVAIPAKSFEIGNLTFNARTVLIVGVVAIIILPLGLLIAGLIIWLKRRKK
jgi:ABC-2 type transport system permease protein